MAVVLVYNSKCSQKDSLILTYKVSELASKKLPINHSVEFYTKLVAAFLFIFYFMEMSINSTAIE